MEVGVLTMNGTRHGTHEVPEEVFNEAMNYDLLHQVVVALQKRKEEPVAHTKGRADRRGGGRKPWRQKGTGRARHGSRRSPIWRKGGVTFGPTKYKNVDARVTKKMKRKAMRMALSAVLEDEELYVISEFSLNNISTKEARKTLENVIPEMQNGEDYPHTLIVLSEPTQVLTKSLRNIENVSLVPAHSLSVEHLLNADTVLTTPAVIDMLGEKYRR